jgi:single-strand DNA-binding protein
MNRVILVGRLARDPEVRYTQSGIAVASMVIAVDRRFSRKAQESGQQTADFINLVAWRQLAEICGNNLAKGRRIGIEGRLQTRSYEAKDGTKRYVTEVVVDELEFLDAKGQAPQGGNFAPQQNANAPVAPASSAPADQDALGSGNIADDEIPF